MAARERVRSRPAAGGREHGLARWQAIPLVVGSIAGSGILFLPSAVYVEAGRNSLLVWVLATAMCLPMLLMFEDMVRASPEGRGIEAFIRAGMGDVVGRCVPIMFLALVIVGLPAGALVAGRYVARALGAGGPAVVTTAVAVLLISLVANLAGVRANTRVQQVGSWALVATVGVLLASTAGGAGGRLSTVAPDVHRPDVLLPGVVLAFRAFSGFENLTFLSREFRRPGGGILPRGLAASAATGVPGGRSCCWAACSPWSSGYSCWYPASWSTRSPRPAPSSSWCTC
jgi:amino acid efflux transporter